MLGLEKGKVKLVEHDPEWAKAFAQEKAVIDEILQKAGLKAVISHVGSTSIKEMKAKPIVDIAVGFKNSEEQKAGFRVLRDAGLQYISAVKMPGLYLLAKGDPVQFHYHVVVRNTFAWNRLLHFRNYLRKNKKLVQEYEALKMGLADEYAEYRVLYTRGKEDYVNAILTRAAGDLRREHRDAALNSFKTVLRKNGIRI